MAVVYYGLNSSVELGVAGGMPPVQCGLPRGEPLDDPAAAISQALSDPLEYPPLARSTTPGDQVVLALDHNLPQSARITAAVIGALVEAGVDPDGIAVLRAGPERDAGDPRRLLPQVVRERISLLAHDAGDRNQLAYLAATPSGEPILLNRAIHDADVVLPIGCLRDTAAAGYYGIHGVVYPTFSDQKTLSRFRSVGSLSAHGRQKSKLIEEVDHVAWLLGINFTIQLVPAGGVSILHVLAGQSEAVRRRGQWLLRAAWRWPVSRQAALVVAAVEGDADQQTWENLGRALEAATTLVEDEGAIAVCCELSAGPGAAVQQMIGAYSRQAAMQWIRQHRPADALTALQLARALDRGRVYLLSRLDPSLVEDLDIIHVDGPDELVRLARQHTSCILVSNAPHAIVAVDESSAVPSS